MVSQLLSNPKVHDQQPVSFIMNCSRSAALMLIATLLFLSFEMVTVQSCTSIDGNNYLDIHDFSDKLTAKLIHSESVGNCVQVTCIKDFRIELGWFARNGDTLTSEWISGYKDTLSIDLSRTANCGMVGSVRRYKIGIDPLDLCHPTSSIEMSPGMKFVVPLKRITQVSTGDFRYLIVTIGDNTNVSVLLQ